MSSCTFAGFPTSGRCRVTLSTRSLSHFNAVLYLSKKAEQISSQWKGTSATGGKTKNFIDSEFVESKTAEWIDTHDPVCNALNGSYLQTNEHAQSTQTLLTHIPQTTNSEFMATIEDASHAYKSWSRTSVVPVNTLFSSASFIYSHE